MNSVLKTDQATTKAINRKNELKVAAKAVGVGTKFFLKDIADQGKKEYDKQIRDRNKKQRGSKLSDRLRNQLQQIEKEEGTT